MSTNHSPRDVEPVAVTDSMNWDAVNSNHSSEEAQAVEASEANEILTEGEPQAAHSASLRRKAEVKRVE